MGFFFIYIKYKENQRKLFFFRVNYQLFPQPKKKSLNLTVWLSFMLEKNE